MSTLRLFLAACFLFLSLLLSRVSSHCQLFPRSTCEQHSAFVPGHNLAGEGIDITTLARKGAYLVDSSRWQDPNGTCTLCRNPLMDGQLQRLPLASVDWRVRTTCYRQVTSSVKHSDMDVMKALAGEVKNEWKIDLGLPKEMDFLKSQVVFAGSHSQMAIYAHKKAQQDRLRLLQRPSLLTPHFSHAVGKLPSKHDPEEYQHVIDTYGTHYISQVQLGGRVRNLLAVRTCEAVLAGLTASDIKDCLTVEASVGPDLLSETLRAKCQELKRGRAKGAFWEAYGQRRTEAEGGDSQVELLFTEVENNIVLFSEWMETLKTRPGIVSYSLLPIHTLIAHGDPRRDVLRKAVRDYITQRAQWRNCTEQCPYGSYKHSDDPCKCVCHDESTTDAMCCARERGIARLQVHVLNGSGLWADYFSATDAYVRVFFRGQELKTSVIQDNNHPVWSESLDFGPVILTGLDYIEVQIWDRDIKHDDLLATCKELLVAGRTKPTKCHPKYGYVKYYCEVQCGPTLGGTSCQNYVSQKQD
ncbi:perforin-1-like isoform X2 [Hemicordylus capensis]|uniref:perforin-1-like isoform X2 n=1 Tax=Hemicordylus capensis TaxID=884348 RepID=UPI002302FE4F|nr:perforin-1-like isoform X2 [Hemicordylus capensis]